jgi:flagellar basal-body rod modification protein FlgD
MSQTHDVNATTYASLGLGLRKDTTRPRNELGQEEFFELMVAQLKNQDPLKPLESNEFLGQVAQFTTVNGIQKLQSSFAGLAASLGSAQALQASTLVGGEVLIAGGTAWLDPSGGVGGVVALPESSRAVTVTVTDSNGRLVDQIALGEQAAGEVPFEWDGTDADGQRVASGVYRITATTVTAEGTVGVETLTTARVESVTLGRAGSPMQLNLAGLGPVSLDQVRQIL